MTDSRVSILVVDEGSEFLREISAGLDAARFRVATSPFGAAALEFLAENRPDFVILDSRLLYLQGVALCGALREHSPRTRVLFLDVDEAWSLFLEPLGSDGSDTRISPCMKGEVIQEVASIAVEEAPVAVEIAPPPS